MRCPACGKKDRTLLLCARCWQLVPGNDRVKLGGMYHRNPTRPKTYQSKLDQVVRDLKLMRGVIVETVLPRKAEQDSRAKYCDTSATTSTNPHGRD